MVNSNHIENSQKARRSDRKRKEQSAQSQKRLPTNHSSSRPYSSSSEPNLRKAFACSPEVDDIDCGNMRSVTPCPAGIRTSGLHDNHDDYDSDAARGIPSIMVSSAVSSDGSFHSLVGSPPCQISPDHTPARMSGSDSSMEMFWTAADITRDLLNNQDVCYRGNRTATKEYDTGE